MSWKSVELQVALPRAQDAGKQQEQMSKQNQRFQESLAQSQLKADQRKRTRVNEFDELTKTAIRDEENERRKHNNLSGDKEQTDSDQESADNTEAIKHPYLGSNIDYSG